MNINDIIYIMYIHKFKSDHQCVMVETLGESPRSGDGRPWQILQDYMNDTDRC